MAPAPNGDHSLGMNGLNAFLVYGPMLRALAHRTWVLEPNAIAAFAYDPSGPYDIHANLFQVPSERRHSDSAGHTSSGDTIVYIAVVKVPSSVSIKPRVLVNITFGARMAQFETLMPGRTAVWSPTGQSGNQLQVTMNTTIMMVRMTA